MIKKPIWLRYSFLGLILLLGSYLRFVSLNDNPGWYTDEGTHLEIAKQFLDGRVQYFAVQESLLIFSRLPLFGWLLTGVGSIWGVNMLILRTLTATLGLLSIVLLYRVVLVAWSNRGLALMAAFCLAVYPEAILYNRFGFSYNLLAPLLLMAIYGVLIAYQADGLHRKRLGIGIAAIAVGLGTITDLAMISAAVWLVLAIAWLDYKQLWWSILLLGFPLGSYVIWMWVSIGDAFFFDLSFVQSRLSGRSLWGQGWLVLENYTKLLSQQSWFAFGAVGLWLLPSGKARWLVLLALGTPIVMLGRTAPLVELSFYYVSWLLPLVALGFGSLLWFGWFYVVEQLPNRWLGTAVAICMIALPMCVSTLFTYQRATNSFGTVIDPFLIDADDAAEVADFIAQNSSSADLVIASPGIGWQFETNTADFQMALAAEGIATPHLPGDLPEDRYVFDPRFEQAKYVVVDNIWRNWAVFHVPMLPDKIAEIETWPTRFRSGNITVYENPQAAR